MAREITQELMIGEEKIPLNFDFTTHPAIKAGLTITGVAEITIAPSGEVTAESATVNAAGTVVQALWTPGSVEKTYTVCCKVTTSGAAKPKVNGKLKVSAC